MSKTDNRGKFLKKLWCHVRGGGVDYKIIWFYQDNAH